MCVTVCLSFGGPVGWLRYQTTVAVVGHTQFCEIFASDETPRAELQSPPESSFVLPLCFSFGGQRNAHNTTPPLPRCAMFVLVDDVLLHIFSFAPADEIVRSYARVCRRWRELSRDNSLWQLILSRMPLCLNDHCALMKRFGVSASEGGWYRMFQVVHEHRRLHRQYLHAALAEDSSFKVHVCACMRVGGGRGGRRG